MCVLLHVGASRVTVTQTVSDGQWHAVQWKRSNREFFLTLDSNFTVQGVTPGNFTRLDVQRNGFTYVHIGGIEDYSGISNEGMAQYETRAMCVNFQIIETECVETSVIGCFDAYVCC